MFQDQSPNIVLDFLAKWWPYIGGLLTAGWIGSLVKGMFARRKLKADAGKVNAETEGIDIENEQKRLDGYIGNKQVLQQMVTAYEALAEQLTTTTNELRVARGELNEARADIESRNAVIRHQQEENRWLVEREAKFYAAISKAEAHNKECQAQLIEQGSRIAELERLNEKKTETELRG